MSGRGSNKRQAVAGSGMRSLGLFIASLGGSAFIYVGASLLGEMLLPSAGAEPSNFLTLLAIGGVGGIVTVFGLSLALRTP